MGGTGCRKRDLVGDRDLLGVVSPRWCRPFEHRGVAEEVLLGDEDAEAGAEALANVADEDQRRGHRDQFRADDVLVDLPEVGDLGLERLRDPPVTEYERAGADVDLSSPGARKTRGVYQTALASWIVAMTAPPVNAASLPSEASSGCRPRRCPRAARRRRSTVFWSRSLRSRVRRDGLTGLEGPMGGPHETLRREGPLW